MGNLVAHVWCFLVFLSKVNCIVALCCSTVLVSQSSMAIHTSLWEWMRSVAMTHRCFIWLWCCKWSSLWDIELHVISLDQQKAPICSEIPMSSLHADSPATSGSGQGHLLGMSWKTTFNPSTHARALRYKSSYSTSWGGSDEAWKIAGLHLLTKGLRMEACVFNAKGCTAYSTFMSWWYWAAMWRRISTCACIPQSSWMAQL